MIGTGADLSFLDFFKYETGISFLNTMLASLIIYFMFKRNFQIAKNKTVASHLKRMIPEKAIKDRFLMRAGLIILFFVIVLFFLADWLKVSESVIALIGGSLSLFIVIEHETVEKIVTDVEWTTLLFFMSLFIIVGYLESTGILDRIAHILIEASGGNSFKLVMLILWGSAILSAFVDNVPFTATMIPIIISLISSNPSLNRHNVLWWALSMGACLGGNAVPIGASANLVVTGIAKRNGIDISFKEYTKVGVPVTIAVLIMSSAYLFLLLSI